MRHVIRFSRGLWIRGGKQVQCGKFNPINSPVFLSQSPRRPPSRMAMECCARSHHQTDVLPLHERFLVVHQQETWLVHKGRVFDKHAAVSTSIWSRMVAFVNKKSCAAWKLRGTCTTSI